MATPNSIHLHCNMLTCFIIYLSINPADAKNRMAKTNNIHLHGNMLTFFKKHIQKTIETCSKDSTYSWNIWRDHVDPLIEVSEAVGVDAEELKRAKDAYINAQVYLLHVKQAQILKLKEGTFSIIPPGDENLT